MIRFNRNNLFGKRLVEAIIPGWGSGLADANAAVSDTGLIRSVGRRNIEYVPESSIAAPPSVEGYIREVNSPDHRGRPARYIEIDSDTFSSGYRYRAAPGDIGPISDSSDAFSIIGIVKLIGNGAHGVESSDPRIWTKDQGSAGDDHDLMLGLVRSNGHVTPRTRVRTGGSTATVFVDGAIATNVVDDGWHLIAMSARQGGSTLTITIHGLYPDGRYVSNFAPISGNYTPRTTTTEAMWATAGLEQNYSEMGILGVWFFEDLLVDEGMLREFWKNPWQVFAPQRFFVPMDQGTAIVTIDEEGGSTVIITDVNTNETWQDGATGLIVTGTGFV